MQKHATRRRRTNRGRPTVAESRQKLAHILEVARQEFGQRGYSAVTMRDIAERAQVSTRTLYNHFNDKLSLFVACVERGVVKFPRLDLHPSGDVRETLRRHAVAVVMALSHDLSLRMAALIHRESVDVPEMREVAQAYEAKYMVQPVAQFLHETGLAAEDDAGELANLFWALAFSNWQRRTMSCLPAPDDEVIESETIFAVDVFLDGVRGVRSKTSAGNEAA